MDIQTPVHYLSTVITKKIPFLMKMLPLKENSDRNTQAQRQVTTFLEIIFQWQSRAHCEFGLTCGDRYKDSSIQKTLWCCDSREGRTTTTSRLVAVSSD